jgi:hypothetical protein
MSRESEEGAPFLASEKDRERYDFPEARTPLVKKVQSSWLKLVLALYSVVASGALVFMYVRGSGSQPYSMYDVRHSGSTRAEETRADQLL